MAPAIFVAQLWMLFGGTHVGLATVSVRGALSRRLGERGFAALYWTIAVATFTILVTYYAAHRDQGAPGLALGAAPALRWPLMAAVGAGVVLSIAGLFDYPRSPTSMFGVPSGEPRGMARITRHPFFSGVALLAIAHTLLATQLVGAVFMAGLAALAIAGAWHQDRKLLVLRGRPYAEHVAVSSAVPFAAVLAGRQRIVWRELPFAALALGVAAAFALRAVHHRLFAAGGLWFIGAVVAGGGFATLQAWRRSRRHAGGYARLADNVREAHT